MSREEEDLATHVEICSLRYNGLQQQIDILQKRVDIVEVSIKELRKENDMNFNDIKELITNQKDERFKVMVTSTATIIVGLLAMLGYVITHIAK